MALRPQELGQRLHALRRVTRAAGRDDVRLRVVPPATQRNDVIHRESCGLAEAVGAAGVIVGPHLDPLVMGEVSYLAAPSARTAALLTKSLPSEILVCFVKRRAHATTRRLRALPVEGVVVRVTEFRVGTLPLKRSTRGVPGMTSLASRGHRIGRSPVGIELGPLQRLPAVSTSFHCRESTGESPDRG